MDVETFLRRDAQRYIYPRIRNNIADNVQEMVSFLKQIPNHNTLIFKQMTQLKRPSILFSALYQVLARIKFPNFVLFYTHSNCTPYLLSEFYTSDPHPLIFVHETSFPLVDFLSVDGNIKRYIFLDLLFSSDRPGDLTWHDVVQNIIVWDGMGRPTTIPKPENLKNHACRHLARIERQSPPLEGRYIITTYNGEAKNIPEILSLCHLDCKNPELAFQTAHKLVRHYKPFRLVSIFHMCRDTIDSEDYPLHKSQKGGRPDGATGDWQDLSGDWQDPSDSWQDPSAARSKAPGHMWEPSGEKMDTSGSWQEPSGNNIGVTCSWQEPSGEKKESSGHMWEPSGHMWGPSDNNTGVTRSWQGPSDNRREASANQKDVSGGKKEPKGFPQEPKDAPQKPKSSPQKPSRSPSDVPRLYDVGFLILKLEFFSDVSFRKQRDLYSTCLDLAETFLARDLETFVEDFNTSQTLSVKTPFPLSFGEDSHLDMYEVSRRYQPVASFIAEEYGYIFSKTLSVPKQTRLQVPAFSTQELKKAFGGFVATIQSELVRSGMLYP